MIFIVSAITLYLLSILVIAVFAYRKLFHPAYKSLEFTRTACMEREEFDEAFENLPWCGFEAKSRLGYTLKGIYLPGEAPSGGAAAAPTAVFVHGITWTRYGMFKYMRSFILKGWNVVAFDLVGHGATGAHGLYSPSFGVNERHDVAAALEAAKALFPASEVFGLVGESLGAASCLQYAGMKGAAADFIVADCPFSSGLEELDARLQSLGLPRILWVPSVKLVAIMATLFRGFSLEQASSIKAVLSTDIPILFVHGLEDRYVPFFMSIRMYNERVKAGLKNTGIHLTAGARHAKSWNVDPAGWEKAVFEFIGEYIDKAGPKG